MSGGKAESFYRYSWNIAGRCLEPVHIECVGNEWADRHTVDPRHTQMLEMTVKCRSCKNCFWERQMSWQQKSRREYEKASRTWFGTLTMSPAVHHKMVARAATRLKKGGTSIEALGSVENFEEHCIEAGKELTKFFKRLRKNYSAKIRYLVVIEPHRSGLPHYHLLVHEQDPKAPLRKKQLVAEWSHMGFSKFLLAKTSKDCAYASKYLAKMKTTRVRASLQYGRSPDGEAVTAP